MNKGQINIAFLLLASLLSSSSATDIIADNKNLISKESEAVIQTSLITRHVPFYSQLKDITDPAWRGVSCGVASLAMLIDYYTDAVDPDTLLSDGLAAGAYNDSVGWYHVGLINLAKSYGLDGETKHLGNDKQFALQQLEAELEAGPVMASVHYTFDYNNPIPHLVVITDINDQTVHYNDPAEESGNGTIHIDKFASSWKNRIISIRPTT